jgi:PKD repeat protein
MHVLNSNTTNKISGFLAILIALSFILSNCSSEDEPTPLQPDFSWNPASVGTGIPIAFINKSKGNPEEFSWTFDGGTPATSSEENPSTQFSEPGEVDVTLTISSGSKIESVTKTITVICNDNPCKPIEAKFTSNKTFAKAGNSIQFTDQSVGVPTSWAWTFDGGTPETSSEQNPAIIYAQPGFYKVTLKSSKTGSTDTEVKENYVTVGCNGDYCDDTFSSFIKTTNVVYGIDANQHQLNLYEPDGDVSTSRPLVILFGGGAFAGSDLSLLEPLAQKLTNYGFVVAAARYRNGPTSEASKNFIRGQQDVNAAVRYFRKEAVLWKIDPDKIFIGGNGTGAFLALSRSYLDTDEIPEALVSTVNELGGLEGAQGNEGFSSEPSGCISLAGGIYTFDQLELIKNNDVPLFAVHGTSDTEVPIGTTSGNPTLYGAKPVTDKTKSVGLATYLYSIENGNHDAPRSSSALYINQLITWLHLVMNP